MFQYLAKYWYFGFILVTAVGTLLYQSRRGGHSKGLLSSLRRNITRHEDPESPLYDPGLFGRQLRLLVIGLPLIAFALLIVWFIQP